MNYKIFGAVVLVSLVIFFTFYFKEDYISRIYYPTQLELNPIKIFAEENDTDYIQDIMEKIPIRSVKNKRNAHVIFEPISNIESDSKYKLLSKMSKIYLYGISKTNTNITKMSDLKNKKVGIKRGYAEKAYRDILKDIDVQIVLYNSDDDARKMFENNDIDVILLYQKEPSRFVQKISNFNSINFIPIFANSKKFETEDEMTLLPYKTTVISKVLRTSCSYLSLFVDKSVDTDIVFEICNFVFRPKGITRSLAVLGDQRVEIHSGVRKWLLKNGFINISTNESLDGCELVAGVTPCEGQAKIYANKIYKEMNMM